MPATLYTVNEHEYAHVEASPKYFTEVTVTANSGKKQIVVFDIDGEQTKIEGTGDEEEIGTLNLPESFKAIKVYVSYEDNDGNTQQADELQCGDPYEAGGGYNMATIRAENGDDDDYEVEIKFEGKEESR